MQRKYLQVVTQTDEIGRLPPKSCTPGIRESVRAQTWRLLPSAESLQIWNTYTRHKTFHKRAQYNNTNLV